MLLCRSGRGSGLRLHVRLAVTVRLKEKLGVEDLEEWLGVKGFHTVVVDHCLRAVHGGVQWEYMNNNESELKI